ncbi:unnamed protein product [Adineta steineri]|uniref:J domain-containing protein n=1 Tax=Adineta steineri TaxID=433720 RepID=A0A813N785_9BILA|nr:unnamed protein product [Adineta steineri]
MAATTLTPYEILQVKPLDSDFQLRVAYRLRIHELKKDRLNFPTNRKISPAKFRLICRAYETLSDHDKRKIYDSSKEWTSTLPLTKYTLQQLAGEPDLAPQLRDRLEKATLRQIDAKDPKTDQTPLYCAARACNVDAVYHLTEQGAEPDLAQRTGSTALHVSAFYGHPEIVRCLLESGADYRKQNSYKNTPEKESFDDNVRNTFTDMKKQPFVQAAADQLDWFKENIDTIPNHIDEQYYRQCQTLLHCASRKGFTDLARWLVEQRSANLDIVDNNLNSALHLAAYGGHTAIVEFLLHQGANSILINKWGMTAEQEGIVHGTQIVTLFQAMRNRNMFDMAAQGVEWWFKYHFAGNSPDATTNEGTSLLYIASRHGQTSVVKWLLENGANVNIQLTSVSHSTSLHTAAYNDHISTVELLINHGADVNIKNHYGETVFDNARSDKMKNFLQQYRKNLLENKILIVHLFGDGRKTGNEPLAKLQLNWNATRDDLWNAMPESLRKEYHSFSIARRPLQLQEKDTTIISAFCRARYGKSKFVELPLCITAHESPRYVNSGHILGEEVIDYNSREFQAKFMSKCQNSSIKIASQLNKIQKFTCGNLSVTFPVNCASKQLSIDVEYIDSPDLQTFKLPECLCLFRTKFQGKNNALEEMPNVVFNGDSNVRLYSWIQSQAYWFAHKIRHGRLPFIDGVHAFIRHVDIIPAALNLPPDMFIQAAVGKPFNTRDHPVYCRYLKIREHKTDVYPHIAYHGTSIKVIPSILMDGLVMPSTVVSNGIRVCPPDNHIARGVNVFDTEDFSNGIFVSPSIHYCSDPVYAVTFSDGDERLVAVLECAVKRDAFKAFPSTVPGYKGHEGDDLTAIEWRLTNPAAIEIISILFIPQIKSRIAAARLRAGKLGVNPNDVT